MELGLCVALGMVNGFLFSRECSCNRKSCIGLHNGPLSKGTDGGSSLTLKTKFRCSL